LAQIIQVVFEFTLKVVDVLLKPEWKSV